MHFSPRPNRAAEIKWRPWGNEAFAEAQAQGKPVLLGISAVWCHWCHVMDETSYSDDKVIRLINERFIPIRVDNDQRPDVNARYNMGGWPTTVFLTPEGEILHGGTYVPPEILRSLLVQIADYYAQPSNRLALSKRMVELRGRREAKSHALEDASLDPATAQQVMEALAGSFDDEYGGFGDEPKFPQTNVLHFLLDYFARTNDARAQTMVQKTLHGMAGGGMYDHVEGGFFRYSTTRDWSIPHYEKMLEDLAGLLLACARASAMFGDADLARVVTDVVRYLDAALWNGKLSAYGGSQDADEEYYRREAVERTQLPKPYVDPIIYASWNAEMARALIISAGLLGGNTTAWARRGVEVLETIWSKMLVDGLIARYYDGAAHVRGLLGDQAWCAFAALAAFSSTGEAKWLERAGALIKASEVLFSTESGAYFDRLPGANEPARVAQPSSPIEENSIMARALLTYGAFTGESRQTDRARALLSRFTPSSGSLGLFAAGYASAVLDAVEPPIDIHIVGSPVVDAARTLRAAALHLAMPPARVDPIDPARDAARLRTLGYEAGDEPTAYLCRGAACFAKVKSPDELAGRLLQTTLGTVEAVHVPH